MTSLLSVCEPLLKELSENAKHLTPADRSELKSLTSELERRERIRRLEGSLYEFVKEAWVHIESAPFIDNWHIKAICDHLQAVTEGHIPKLLINEPPGCSKSLLTCVLWPCWEWAKNPTIRWFFASYDQRLSTRDSVKCRTLLASMWYQKLWGNKFTLTVDQNQKTYYETSAGGYRLATSVNGHGTGEHPDRVICDDPHNVKEAESEVERQTTLDWWTQTMPSRGLSRGARRVIIMQRLHHEDLSGHAIKTGDYVHICLPMRYEGERMAVTPLGWKDPRTKEGELLTPNQFTESMVAELEKNLGAYGTAGQLQQRPQPKSGGMFKADYFTMLVKAAPYHCKRIRYWDRAATPDGGCFTAGTLMARDDLGNFYVEHVCKGQWEPDERNAMMLATAQADARRYGPHNPPLIFVEAEGGSSGRDAWKGVARALAGFPVREDRVSGKKEVRAEPWACQLAAKNVFMVDDGTWDVNDYISEHCAFPLGKYKDQVDASCLVAGTLVDTFTGQRQIESVLAGEYVLTRNGYRLVVWSGQSGAVNRLVSVLFSNGSCVTGTYNHLVWTLNRGWCKLGELYADDMVVVNGAPACQRECLDSVRFAVGPSSVPVVPSAAPRRAPRSGDGMLVGENTSTKLSCLTAVNTAANCRPGDTSKVAMTSCTGTCGGQPTEAFPTAMLFITKTRIRLTTRLRILRACHTKSMVPNTVPTGKLLNTLRTWRRSVKAHVLGTLLQKDGSGTLSTPSEPSASGRQQNTCALNAASHLRQRAQDAVTEANRDTAPTCAMSATEPEMDDGENQKAAQYATRNSWECRELDAAPVNVVRNGDGLIPVYDLTVDREHEFFANGVLVHNSGAFNLLAGMKPAGSLRVYSGSRKPGLLRIVCCERANLAQVLIDEHKALFLSVQDPLAAGSLPEHGFGKLLDTLVLQFADLDPAECQESWGELVAGYGKPAEDLVMTPQHARKFWNWYQRERAERHEVLVICQEDGKRVAKSLAYSIADSLGLSLAEVVYDIANPDEPPADEAPNKHVYECLKTGRY